MRDRREVLWTILGWGAYFLLLALLVWFVVELTNPPSYN
jgi:uncharacterized membrane protein YjfL (UPF0719 family)